MNIISRTILSSLRSTNRLYKNPLITGRISITKWYERKNKNFGKTTGDLILGFESFKALNSWKNPKSFFLIEEH